MCARQMEQDDDCRQLPSPQSSVLIHFQSVLCGALWKLDWDKGGDEGSLHRMGRQLGAPVT